jgi:hypothetical protein
MSALGQKQTSDCRLSMSALPPKADITERNWDFRLVPISDNRTIVNSLVLSNHLDRTRAGDESRMWRDEKPYSSGVTGGTSVIRRAPRLKVT